MCAYMNVAWQDEWESKLRQGKGRLLRVVIEDVACLPSSHLSTNSSTPANSRRLHHKSEVSHGSYRGESDISSLVVAVNSLHDTEHGIFIVSPLCQSLIAVPTHPRARHQRLLS